MNSLAFNGIAFKPINRQDNQIWLTTSQLAEALEYSDVRSVTNIYNRKKDEFTSGMTEVINLVTSEKSANLQTSTRIFSLRGCHLIAMFARTKVAKEFRKWVLDILDKEVGKPVQVNPRAIKINDTQAHQIQKAIKQKCLHNRLHYQTLYHAIYNVFGVKSYKDILASDFDEVMSFIAKFGFHTDLIREQLYDIIAECAVHLHNYRELLDKIKHQEVWVVGGALRELQITINRLGFVNSQGLPMFEPSTPLNCLNFYNGYWQEIY